MAATTTSTPIATTITTTTTKTTMTTTTVTTLSGLVGGVWLGRRVPLAGFVVVVVVIVVRARMPARTHVHLCVGARAWGACRACAATWAGTHGPAHVHPTKRNNSKTQQPKKHKAKRIKFRRQFCDFAQTIKNTSTCSKCARACACTVGAGARTGTRTTNKSQKHKTAQIKCRRQFCTLLKTVRNNSACIKFQNTRQNQCNAVRPISSIRAAARAR